MDEEDWQDGYMDGYYCQRAQRNRGDGYDDGYIEGSSDYLDVIEKRNGTW